MARKSNNHTTPPKATGKRPDPAAPSTAPGRLRLWLSLALIFAVWTAYATSFAGTFVFDDENQILQNPAVTDSGFVTILDKSTRPIVNLTLAMDYRLAGGNEIESLDELPSTVPFHITNLVIHTLAALTLFALIGRTLTLPRFEGRFSPDRAVLIAFALACLWALHPLNTQSVTYIVQRAEAMMGLFYLFTLYALLRTARSAGPASAMWATACVVSCAMGMGSKAVMVTAPLAALAFDHTFLARSAIDALRKRWPLYVALCCTWVILDLVGIAPGVFNPHPTANPTVGFTIDSITPAQYFFTQPQIILHYLRLSVLPVGLTLDYRWPREEDFLIIALSTAVLSTAGLWVARELLRRTWVGFVGAFFFLVLSTTSSFVPITDLAFEHRMYLPLISVVVLVSVGAWRLLGRFANIRGAGGAVIAFTLGAIALGALTSARNLDYSSGLEIWQDTFEKRPTNARAATNYASMLARAERYEESLELFEKAIELEPGNADTLAKYARALSETGERSRAIELLEQSLDINPDQPLAMQDLLGEYTLTGRWAEAIPLAQQILEFAPDDTLTKRRLASALLETGDSLEALKMARELVSDVPESVPALFLLGRSLTVRLQFANAIGVYEQILELQPTNISASIGLANLYERRERLDLAYQTLVECSRLPFANPEPRPLATLFFNLGNTAFRYRMEQGTPRADIIREIVPYYERSIEADPTYPNAHYGLGWVKNAEGLVRAAEEHFREALRLDPNHELARQGLDAIANR